MPYPNKYAGCCHACKSRVPAGAGYIESTGRCPSGRLAWRLWCLSCYNASDNSSEEDRACGNRAYEDACGAACGLENDSYM